MALYLNVCMKNKVFKILIISILLSGCISSVKKDKFNVRNDATTWSISFYSGGKLIRIDTIFSESQPAYGQMETWYTKGDTLIQETTCCIMKGWKK